MTTCVHRIISVCLVSLVLSCGGGGGGRDGAGSPSPSSGIPDLPITGANYKSGGVINLSSVPGINLQTDVVHFTPDGSPSPAVKAAKTAAAMSAPGAAPPRTLPPSTVSANSVLLPLYVVATQGSLTLTRDGQTAFARRISIEPHATGVARGEIYRAFIQGALTAANNSATLAATRLLPNDNVWPETIEHVQFIGSVATDLQAGKTLIFGENDSGAKVTMTPEYLDYLDQAVMAILEMPSRPLLGREATAAKSKTVKTSQFLLSLLPSAHAQSSFSEERCFFANPDGTNKLSKQDEAFCISTIASATGERSLNQFLSVIELLNVLEGVPGLQSVGLITAGGVVLASTAAILANRFRHHQTLGATCKAATTALVDALQKFGIARAIDGVYGKVIQKPLKLVPEGQKVGWESFAYDWLPKQVLNKYVNSFLPDQSTDLCAPKAVGTKLEPTDLTLDLGREGRMTISFFDEKGNWLRAPNDTHWSTDRASVASLTPAGDTAFIKGLATGAAAIAVTSASSGLQPVYGLVRVSGGCGDGLNAPSSCACPPPADPSAIRLPRLCRNESAMIKPGVPKALTDFFTIDPGTDPLVTWVGVGISYFRGVSSPLSVFGATPTPGETTWNGQPLAPNYYFTAYGTDIYYSCQGLAQPHPASLQGIQLNMQDTGAITTAIPVLVVQYQRLNQTGPSCMSGGYMPFTRINIHDGSYPIPVEQTLPEVPADLQLVKTVPPRCNGVPDEPWRWNPNTGPALDAVLSQRYKAFDASVGSCLSERWYCKIGNQVCISWAAQAP